MRVKCAVEEVELEDDYGGPVAGVCATCSRCNHEASAYGTGEASVKRALVMLREECPEGESNFYVDDDEGASWR